MNLLLMITSAPIRKDKEFDVTTGNAIDLIYHRVGDYFPSTSFLFPLIQVLGIPLYP